MKALSFNEFKKIYKNGIKKDFPKDEQRPLFALRVMYNREQYTCFSLEEDDKVLGYSTIAGDKDSDVKLLDFFAVNKNERGTGIGSRYLQDLRKMLNIKGLLLECEMPKKAKSKAERILRERRIDFYLKNGAELTGVDIDMQSVSFHILWFPIKGKLKDINPKKELKRIYNKVMFPSIYYKNIVTIT